MASQKNRIALTMAARHGHKGTVELLLDRGADIEVKDRVSRARQRLSCRTACGRHGRAVDRGVDGGSVMACWMPLGH